MHTTEVVAAQKLNNGQIAVCIRCCGNPSTDHWHTMAAGVSADPEKRKASLAEQHVFCAKQHADIEKGTAGVVLELGTDALKIDHQPSADQPAPTPQE